MFEQMLKQINNVEVIVIVMLKRLRYCLRSKIGVLYTIVIERHVPCDYRPTSSGLGPAVLTTCHLIVHYVT